MKITDAARIPQIQYCDAHIVLGALPFTSQSKLESDLALEAVDNRAKFLGLTIFYKINILGSQGPSLEPVCHKEIQTTLDQQAAMFNRPGVAGGVLQTPPSFIDSFIQRVSDPFPHNLQNIITPKPFELGT